MRQIVIGFALVLLTACATEPQTRPDGRSFTQADAGPRPDRNRVIVDYLNEVLKDPESARVSNIAGPVFITIPSEFLRSGTYGWGICFWVNAKNSFGGYTGSRPFALIWRGGMVQRVYGDSRDNIFDRLRAENLCQTIRQATQSHEAPNEPSAAAGPQKWPKPADNLFEGQPSIYGAPGSDGQAAAPAYQPAVVQRAVPAPAPRPFRPAACDWPGAKQGAGAC
jgi:hypothetical protein